MFIYRQGHRIPVRGRRLFLAGADSGGCQRDHDRPAESQHWQPSECLFECLFHSGWCWLI